MVITCDYCGGCVTLGGAGWKEINKHTMLPLKVPDRDAALKVVHGYMDQGFLHRHVFEDSKLLETRLSYVPFWVLPGVGVDDLPVPGRRDERRGDRRHDGRGRSAGERSPGDGVEGPPSFPSWPGRS